MKRLTVAPNIALATLWRDLLGQAGIEATVERLYAGGIAGEVPPDQALPEIWVVDDEQLEPARVALEQLRSPPQRRWICRGCGERIEGGFEECWNCGTPMP